ncbi:hypothetical protein B0P06_003847 [Clostridium saccharoperbutylacetonicum]|uniref:Uncharacterized protein n=1 Tax=Clostridium saccharoperbutylacetonicum N1-4(HMT) TaxID=931276 RepID=M1MIU1_9CLOT|nr:hypothetical protein [Clostridium saccharoperbutylacetonicum]AGF57844.1 hypothetical protein Cspa_c40910 [Clostridium saccharoperbutylacetonicum N1-4(HMT)]NRT61384.1 hypothetical protein [Clostridium saccharoperbutylacetonicum]NSB24702.1 hypothetical protein [Clostridium saccharoperbutylacetonicum]NSB44076.1 hypothetical protein [Clostridium saccharoperbutylacetonicum]
MIKLKQQTIDLALLIFTVILGIFSYIFNLGWIRLIFFLPFLIYNLIILISGIIYVSKNCNEGNKKRKLVFYLGLLTYMLFNVFFIDGGDIGPSYCFFSLIKVYGNGALFTHISMTSLAISLICIVLNIKAIITKKTL